MTVDGDSVFLQRCDSPVDSPHGNMPDDVSLYSIDDQVRKSVHVGVDVVNENVHSVIEVSWHVVKQGVVPLVMSILCPLAMRHLI